MSGRDLNKGETEIDVSHLKVKGVWNKDQLNSLEAENIRKAVVKYLSQRPTRRLAPFDFSWFKQLHEDMFGEVWNWAGRFRQEDLNLGIKWTLIQESVQSLVEDLVFWEENDVNVVERAAKLHYQGVHIHPFRDGNGRWARMLANIYLMLHDCSVTEWSPSEVGSGGELRKEYIATLKAADEGDLGPLIALHQRFASMPSRPVISQPTAGRFHARPRILNTWTNPGPGGTPDSA